MYTGFMDVARQTLAREGWIGMYKGLVPNLAKVVPAVSISYVVSYLVFLSFSFSLFFSGILHLSRRIVDHDQK